MPSFFDNFSTYKTESNPFVTVFLTNNTITDVGMRRGLRELAFAQGRIRRIRYLAGCLGTLLSHATLPCAIAALTQAMVMRALL